MKVEEVQKIIKAGLSSAKLHPLPTVSVINAGHRNVPEAR